MAKGVPTLSGFYFLLKSILIPNENRITPVILSCQCQNVGFFCSRLLKPPVTVATSNKMSVPCTSNHKPRNAIWPVRWLDCGLMNCGKNDKKKIATLGLRTLVNIPCKNIFRLLIEGSDAISVFVFLWLNKARTPR